MPVDPRGVNGPTPGQARGPRWRTTSANRFVPSGVSGADTEQRIVEAISGAPDGAGVTGWAALHWQGAVWFEGRSSSGEPLPVPVAIGDRAAIAQRSGVRLCFDWLFDGDNVPIFDRQGSHLLTPDLFDPVAGIVGEYNGVIHDLTRVRRRDVNREEICRDLDLEQVAMMSTDLKDNSFERRLDAAYRRAAARPLTDSWTLDQPAWWLDTSTVAAHRALDLQQRERWLRRSAG